MEELKEALNQLRRQASNIDSELVSQIKDKGTYTEVTRQLGKIDDILSDILFDLGKSEGEKKAEEIRAELARMEQDFRRAVL